MATVEGPADACHVSNGVNRVIPTARRLLPVYPDKRTFSEPVGMSQKVATSGSELARNHLYDAERYRSIWMKSRITAMARSGAWGIVGN